MVHSTVKVNPFKVAAMSDVCVFRDGFADNGHSIIKVNPFKVAAMFGVCFLGTDTLTKDY
jgi:hypothetical protein